MTKAVDTWTNQYGDKFRVWLGMGTKPFIILSKPEDLEVREIYSECVFYASTLAKLIYHISLATECAGKRYN